MLEFLYSVVIVVCLDGGCSAFIIDAGVTLDSCLEQLIILSATTPNSVVPSGECIMDSMTI